MPESTAQKQKVLIVEDEAVVAWNLEYVVQVAGYEVVGPATSLSDAMRFAKTFQIDAALLDIRLGADEVVFPAAELLKQRGIPFVFTTSFSREIPRSHGFKEPTLLKPLERSVVEKMIKYLTQAPRPLLPRRTNGSARSV